MICYAAIENLNTETPWGEKFSKFMINSSSGQDEVMKTRFHWFLGY